MKTVFVQNWEESEAGWGVRPDGFTVHISEKQLSDYVNWFNTTFNNKGYVPEEYTRVSGDAITVKVSDELFEKIEKTSMKTRDGRVINAVHGVARSFSAESLEEKDIQL